MHLREERNRGGWLRTSSCHPRNQSSSLEGSGHGGGFHTSPTLLAARESIAIISGSVSGTATVPEGGNCVDASSPEKSDSPSDAAIDIRSSGGAPKDTDGAHLWDGPPRSPGSSTGCGVQEEWVFLGGWFPRRKRTHCDPQITSATARSNPLRRIGTRQRHWDSAPLQELESRPQLRDGHLPTMGTWLIHKRCLSVR